MKYIKKCDEKNMKYPEIILRMEHFYEGDRIENLQALMIYSFSNIAIGSLPAPPYLLWLLFM
jgi:hypothetical protein